MKVLLDTSVLVAGLVRAHPRHAQCRPWLTKMQAEDLHLVLAAHSLAELHAVLTTLPVKPRISPRTALRLAQENQLRPPPEGKAEVVTLSVDDYLTVLESAAHSALAGGIIYDALISRAAQKTQVDQLVTLNPDHFRRVWPAGADRVREP